MHLRITRAYWPAFALVLLAGAYVNLGRIRVPTVLQDEVTYLHAGWRYVHGTTRYALPSVVYSNADNFEHPPLGKYLFGLAQLVVGHESLFASRFVAGISILLTAVVVARWLAVAGRRWEGLVAAGLILLLPQGIAPQTTRFASNAFLDNLAVLPVAGSVALTYLWARAERGRRDWVWALVLGGTVGLACAIKEYAFLGVVGPLALLVVRTKGGRARLERIAQIAVAALVAVVLFVVTYLPLGRPFARIRFLIDFQSDHSDRGHPVTMAGQVYAHPPWWANLWFAGHSLGPLTVVVLVALAVAGVTLAYRSMLVHWTLAALATPFVFHSFVAGVVLPFYWVLWLPLFCVLPAVGAVELARRVWLGTVAAAGALAVLAVVAVQVVTALVALPAIGGANVPRLLGRTSRIALVAAPPYTLSPYFAGKVFTTLPRDPSVLKGIVVGYRRCTRLADPGLLALVNARVADGSLRLEHQDRVFRVYRAVRPLAAPTTAQIDTARAGLSSKPC